MFLIARALLEALFHLSGVLLAVAAVLGLQQIRLLKKDIRIRNERGAKEKAIEFSSRYLNNYVELDGSSRNTRALRNRFSRTRRVGIGGWFGRLFGRHKILRRVSVIAPGQPQHEPADCHGRGSPYQTGQAHFSPRHGWR